MSVRRVNLGDIVTWDGHDWFVDAHSDRGTRLNPVLDGSPVWVDLPTICEDESFEFHGPGDQRGHVAAERIQLGTLAPEVRDDVLFWRDHLNEARYGVTDPHDPEAVPRPGYGKGMTVRERFALKAEELRNAGIEVTDRTLYRKDAEYRDHGIRGLIDKRRFKSGSGTRIPPEVDEVAHRVIKEHLGATTREIRYFLDKVKQRVRQDYPSTEIDWPSERTMRRYLTPLLNAAGLTKTATHRRSVSNRPQRMFQPIVATYPGQYVEIDTNIIDVEVVMPDGKVIRPHMTAAVDVYSGSLVGFHTYAGAPSSVDHGVLFARIASARHAVERLDPSLALARSKALPYETMIAMGQASMDAPAMPYIAVETLTMDRGKDFLASRAAAETLGWSVIDAPPHSPVAKPNVERFFKSMNSLFYSNLDAYVGNSPDHRGREARVPITFADLVDQTWAFVITVYQNRPHKGLVLREHPGRTFSPNQMYAASFDASAGIPLPLTDADYIGLMPRFERTVQPDGIHLEKEIYDSSDLNGLRGRKAKVDVRRDPYDVDRVWVRHPDTGHWITCHARSVRLAALPFGKSISANLAATEQTPDPREEWAQDFMDAEQERVARAKNAARRQKAAEQRASKSATKAAAEKANRKSDKLPRPGAADPTPLPPTRPMRSHPDDYTIA